MDKEQIEKDLTYLDELLLIAKTDEDKFYIKCQQQDLLNMLKPPVDSTRDEVECIGCGA